MPQVMELVAPLREEVLRFHMKTAGEFMDRPFDRQVEGRLLLAAALGLDRTDRGSARA